VEPGSRKRQRNRRKGAPPPEDLVAASVDGAIVAGVIAGFRSLFRRIRRRRYLGPATP